jgi:hypothetical protein
MGSAYTIRLPFVGTRSTERPTLRPRPSYPGHPPAANEGLVSLVPDFILGPRRALDSFRRAAAAWSKRYNPLLFGTRSKASMDWAASAIQPGDDVGASTGRAWTGRRARHAQRTPATQATTRGTRRLLRAAWAAATETSCAVARPGAGESTGTRGGAHANSFRQGGEILVG